MPLIMMNVHIELLGRRFILRKLAKGDVQIPVA